MSRGEAEKERRTDRQRENLKQAPRSVQSLAQGLIPPPWDHDLSQNQESDDTQPTEPPRRPEKLPLIRLSMTPIPRPNRQPYFWKVPTTALSSKAPLILAFFLASAIPPQIGFLKRQWSSHSVWPPLGHSPLLVTYRILYPQAWCPLVLYYYLPVITSLVLTTT